MRVSRKLQPPDERKIEVIRVEPNEVEIRAERVHLVFRCQGKKMGLVAKFNPDKQIYSPENNWVPKPLFNKVFRQAAKILADQRLAALKKQTIPPTQLELQLT